MSKLVKTLAAVALIAGVMAALPGEAEARYRGHWRGGGWGWAAPGFALGFGLGYGWGYPSYYYGGPYYYYPRPYPYYRPYYYARDCGYVRVRVWRNGRWVTRRAWRCWY